MRLLLPLSLCLLFVASSVQAEKVVVEKIISDATAIETIVFESKPAHSQRVSTSSSNSSSSVISNSKHVIIVDDVLKSGSDEKVAQLSQGSPKRPPQSSSEQFYTLIGPSSEADSLSQVVTLVKVDKSKRRMYLLKGDEVIQEFRIALGKQPKGHKRFEGDNRTPEGEYQLDYVMEESDFHRSVHISYPQPSDMQWAEENDVDPGGNIKIHGIKNGERRSPSFIQSFDWTDGCIALTNQDMDEFIQLVKMGTPIHIEW
ncbi:L,D-transpeptidase family protein [Vibrio sp. SNU_ST1]|uniref:L,D-transpeptidase family protein n=1 Tax=Vibrio sp. SNU_ST1 TaxID=3064001 RepID=UPI002729B5E7|nr:L,D-transpeptidase family protein [Vibrio sp. SNU_ST1]WKY59793.1 L,D-transpeptidase family protein [Vibrio sp. SNU_ST1]